MANAFYSCSTFLMYFHICEVKGNHCNVVIFSLVKNKDNYPANLVFQLLKSKEIPICWDDSVEQSSFSLSFQSQECDYCIILSPD